VLIGFDVVALVSFKFAVPLLNSKAAPFAVIVIAAGELAVVGATFIVKLVPLVTLATVALFASPVPSSDIVATRPAVLSHVTVVLDAVVLQFERTTPHAVTVMPEPLLSAGCDMTNEVWSGIDVTRVFPCVPPEMLFWTPAPAKYIPGHRFAVLSHVTLELPATILQPVKVTGTVWFAIPTACLTDAPPTTVHAFIAPVPFQLLVDAG
jgi:hypothetical protein